MANKNKKKIDSFEQLAAAQQHKRPAPSKEEPAISSMLDEFEMWMAVNWKKAIIGVCVFAVVVSIVIIIQGVMKNAEEKARRELANATSIAETEAAIAKHPSNKVADFERIRLAGELISSDKPDDLEKARNVLLEVASSANAEMFVKTRCALDAAYILEKLGKKQDAAEEFKRIADLGQTPEDLRVEAAYSAARLFAGLDQMMNADAALKLINTTAAALNRSGVYSYWATLAKSLDEKIHPKTAAAAQPDAAAAQPDAPAAQPDTQSDAPAAQPAAQPDAPAAQPAA